MGLLFLGFPWSVLSVIGLPGTAFPEKLIERVFKQQYQPSNCFAWYCCDLQNDQRRQQEKQKTQNNLQVVSFFFHDVAVMLRAMGKGSFATSYPELLSSIYPELLSSLRNYFKHSMPCCILKKNRRCAHKDQSFGFTWFKAVSMKVF